MIIIVIIIIIIIITILITIIIIITIFKMKLIAEGRTVLSDAFINGFVDPVSYGLFICAMWTNEICSSLIYFHLL
jgi:hypothetical protein